MNYTLTDNLPDLRVGDTLTLEDGSVHEAVEGRIKEHCTLDHCSIFESCDNCNVSCGIYEFHFKQIKS